MYNQINCLLKDKKQEDADTLAKHVVAMEQYQKELRTHLSFLMKQANELEMNQLSVDLKKKMDGIYEQLKTQVRYCKELTEMLIVNRLLDSVNEEHRWCCNGNCVNVRDDHNVADILENVKSRWEYTSNWIKNN